MTSPTVSVVVATRSRPDLLRRTLAGILAQDYAGAIECVVVFDQADPDLTLEHAGFTEDGHSRAIRVVTNDRTPGLAGARNSGVAASTGDLIAFCDDDDVWLPSKIRLQVEKLASTGADTCVTGITICYENRKTSRVPDPQDMTVETLLRDRVMEAHPSSVMVTRAAMTGPIGEVDEHIPGGYGEDYDWMLRAAAHGPVVVVPVALVQVAWGAHSFFTRDWSTIVEALDYMIAKHPGFTADPAALARLRGQQAFAEAAMSHRGEARHLAMEAARLNPREKRSYVALIATIPGIKPSWILDAAHRTGRGL